MKNKHASSLIKTGLFLSLLLLSNMFLLRSGMWLYLDTAYWPKNNQEALIMLTQQLHVFSNSGYYIGFDQGIFNFTRILYMLFSFVAFHLFGGGGSQIAYVLFGYILTFFSFYLFSKLFFKNTTVCFLLSLVYTFNPLTYQLEGASFYMATMPLFLYSFYKYFYLENKIRILYLIINIIAGFLWISYIRFIQSDLIVMLPYIIYIISMQKKKLHIKKWALFFLAYIICFSPILYSVYIQFAEKSKTAFYYGDIFEKVVVKEIFLKAFDLFPSFTLRIYENNYWIALGVLFFAGIVYLLSIYPKKDITVRICIHMGLVMLGVSFFGLANIFGSEIYLKIISFFPFIVQNPYFAFYVIVFPFVMLLGELSKERIRFLSVYAFLLIIIGTLPLLNVSNVQLKKINLSDIPKPYESIEISPFVHLPEATYYFLGTCWRAAYMEKADTSTQCINFGLKYAPILLDNPRLVSGFTYALSQKMYGSLQVDNLRITHNLKDIIVPNDIVLQNGPGPLTTEDDLQRVRLAHQVLDKKTDMTKIANANFTRYQYNDKDAYDFFLYSPKRIIYQNFANFLSSKNVSLQDDPIILDPSEKKENISNVKIFYKASVLNPTKYYVQVSDIKKSLPFILQFDQSYNTGWEIKKISKEDFDKVSCLQKQVSYVYTDNTRCEYNPGFLGIDMNDFYLLFSPTISGDEHFVGNILGNGWLIANQNKGKYADLSTNFFVIIDKKQIYYELAVIAAACGFCLLVLIAIMQETYSFFYRKYDTT